jgi:hypothetical protein
MSFRVVSVFGVPLFMALCVLTSASRAEETLDFNRDIRPILSENCFVCHGPDAAHQEAGLRLDVREDAMKKLESGAVAIQPGQPDQSELVVRISSEDPDLLMPPADSEKKLTAKQIETLTQWIAQGAKYSDHWAFTAPRRPALPEVKNHAWVKTPIDQFILARLEKEGLTPENETDKATLIRRATVDLTGLPPTPAEVQAFMNDTSPNAYERLLDRLFASPHYGEKMAIGWLDNARYADSNGFQSDGSREIWAWRDWVINAYNRNLPFDQFTIEQLAGDRLPDATKDQIIATGFNRNHRLNGEGGRIVEEWFVETVIDRVETTGLTWLGLTFNCCRCHDHKYDPITQKEFYQFYSFFNSVDENGVLAPAGKNGENTPPLLSLSSPEQELEVARLESVVTAVKKEMKAFESQLPTLVAEWEAKLKAEQDSRANTWQPLEPSRVTSSGGAVFVRLVDGSFLASGNNPMNDEYEITAPLLSPAISGILLEVLPDASLPNQSLGRGSNGNFVMTEVLARVQNEGSSPITLKFDQATADYEQPGWPATAVIAEKPGNDDARNRLGWAVDGNDPQKRIGRRIMFVIDKPLPLETSSELTIRIRHQSRFGDHNIGRFRVSATSVPRSEVVLDPKNVIPADIIEILQTEVSTRSPDQVKTLTAAYRAAPGSLIKLTEDKLKQVQTGLQGYRDSLPTTMVMRETEPRDAFILNRGEYDKPGEKVSRGLPAILPPMPEGQPMDRLGLARWIVDPSNPLTARVWVNRQWEQFFGTGLVKTTENFGSQAEYPSHPELLDWLACEFQNPTVAPLDQSQAAQAWDMKSMQKLMMMSAVYRQASYVNPQKLERDPENRLLARMTRFRLTGEVIRDQALAASGLLAPKIGGPSVRPYMPEGVWDETSKYGNLRNYKHELGEPLYRRTMYTIWKRTAAPPSMLLFDAPNREVCTIKRSRTNTPLQALSLLNEVTFVEAARGLAVRMMREGGDTAESRLAYGFQWVASRIPTSEELSILTQGLSEDLNHFKDNQAAAKQLVSVGELRNDESLDTTELATYILSANVLMNLDEFVTRE